MSENLFPTGEWKGFYNYVPGGVRHWMRLYLEFKSGKVSGSGVDDIGQFTIQGIYSVEKCECEWIKKYLGKHDVFYKGYREGKGIWGVWRIKTQSGGFHIWPIESGELVADVEEEKITLPAIEEK